MRSRRALGPAVAALICVAGCSHSAGKSSSAAGSSTASSSPASASPASASSDPASASSAAAVQAYLDQVNALCDALLPKVLAVMQGGHPDVYPVSEFMAELPQHSQLEAGFDVQLAQVTVPAGAATQQAALQAYITYANGIDAKRLAAARQGQAAFDTEIRAENAEAPTDPVIAARTAAGFHESCNAR